MAKAKGPVVAKFKKERETKNKVRYEEVDTDAPVIDKLYVSKASVKELGDPEELTVSIEAG